MIVGRTRKRQPALHFPWRPGFKTISIAALLILIIFTANKLREVHTYPIHQVSVYGVQHADHEEIQRILAPLVNKGFFAVEVDAIKEQLTQMAWVADAAVRRVWPDQILIVLSERQPVARWNNGSLLSSAGELFNPAVGTYPEKLPQFVGPDGEHIHMLEYYTKINSLLAPLHFKITRLELTPYLSWNMTFNGNMKVNVGYKDVLTRINHFVKVYPKIVGQRATDVDYIDLRYPNGLAVRWKSVT